MSVHWSRRPFDEVFEDVSGGNVKTLQSLYLSQGEYPIVDQGKTLVAGFTNDAKALCKTFPPVIVFGDHTRTLKFIDFPFCMGADGVKVLKPKNGNDPKYLFHYLQHIDIPSAGYDRHFKYLKRLKIASPPLDQQRRIAAILDQAEALRNKRLETLAKLESLNGSIFFKLFGPASLSEKRWKHVRFRDVLAEPLRNGLSPAKGGQYQGRVLTLSAITGLRFDPEAAKESTFDKPAPLNQTVVKGEFLICRGNGNLKLVGLGRIATVTLSDTLFPDTIIATRITSAIMDAEFLEYLWNSAATRKQIESLARTTNGTFKVNQSMLEDIMLICPPIELQREFARQCQSLKTQATSLDEFLRKSDVLFNSLQHRAFSGEL